MDDNLWDTSEVNANKRRSLAEKEQNFLIGDDYGTEGGSNMDGRMVDKTKCLPGRFQQLIDDVSLLYYRGYLEDTEDEVWEDLLSISNRSQVVRRLPVVRTASQQSGPELDFGFEIGSIIRFMHDESVPSELVWGFIIGLVGESDQNLEREVENLSELFEELEDYYETRLVSAGKTAYEGNGLQEERNIIREILREQGFDTAPPLVDAVLQRYTRDGTAEQVKDTKKFLPTDIDSAEHPEPPNESPNPDDIRRIKLESIVSRLTDQPRLRSVNHLARDLREDVFHIQNREIWGVDLDSVIRFLSKNGKTQVSDFDKIKQGQKSRTHALNVLSYTDSSVVNRPVTRKNSEATWSLTAYGELLYKTQIEYNGSINWIFNLITNPGRLDENKRSLISRAIEG